MASAVDSQQVERASTPRSRRLLLITQAYPPAPPPGSNRWSAMCTYLERLGYEVEVLTTSAFGNGSLGRRTIRTRDAMGLAWLRRLRPSVPGPVPQPPAQRRLQSLVKRIAVPDGHAATWMPFAAAATRRLLASSRYDCLITSSPPQSTHLVPLLLGRRRPPWIADFRDGWRFEPLPPRFPTDAQHELDARLERSVAQAADSVVAATPQIAQDLSARLGVGARWIPNGWDPALETDVARSAAPAVRDDRFTFAHTGSLSNAPGKDPQALFEAIRRIVREEPVMAQRFELILAGPLFVGDARLLEAPELRDVVRHAGFIPRPAAVALQRRADALLLLVGEVSAATAKLSEYLFSGRPIIVLGQASEAARIVSGAGKGVAVDAGDPAAIAQALRLAVAGKLPTAVATDGLDDFKYPRPAEWLAEEVERVLASLPKR